MNADGWRTTAALEEVRRAPSILAAIEGITPLGAAAAADGPQSIPHLAAALADRSDQVTAVAAAHAAGLAGAEAANLLLVPLLGGPDPHLAEHAAWALRSAPRVPDAVGALGALASAGGFPGALAEATLEAWGDLGPDPDADAPVPGPTATGLTVAQLFLHAEIDGSLAHAGQGETGGIATLLVSLGDALLEHPGIGRVLTLSRGTADETDAELARPGHHYLGVALPGPAHTAPTSWSEHVPVRRALRRVLRRARVDVLHLRMADVGSWAAAEAARDLGIPVVLTLAPDPHALLAAREASGTLTRATFGPADLAEHLVFRVRLLRDLSEQAARRVVFPRPRLADDLRELLHLDPDDPDARVSVVAEGIDLAPLERAGREVAMAASGLGVPPATADALAALDALLATLPPERRRLPLALSVGRLHRVKGMATLVDAWASDPRLAQRCNLLVVGGDLTDPTAEEADQLARIDAVVPRHQGPERGLLLAGHRPNRVVAVWLAAVRRGRAGLAAPGGVYVCASLKEEFGIALCEALASGLVVVAPHDGGPPTFVEHGVTGLLVDTHDPHALADAVAAALDLAAAPDADARATHAHDLVAGRFSIRTMASALAALYSEVARDTPRHLP